MPDANEIQAALEEVLDPKVESQPTTEPNPDVADALQQALKTGDKAEGASDDAVDKSTDDTSKESKTVPYERLSKVVQQKNELSERYKSLEEQFSSANTREQELRGRIGDLEQDSQILDAIKNLATDEQLRPHVVAIDKALQGITDEIETAEEKGDQQAASNAEKRFEQKAAELEELLDDQRAENLWSEAAGYAKDMLEKLPDGYTDDDRAVIGQLWSNRVDWNGIEQAGSDAIRPALNASLAEVIKGYGIPRGALVANTTKEIEDRVPEARIVSAEDTIKSLTDKDWAETDDKDNLVHSEADFSAGLAEMLRKTRGA